MQKKDKEEIKESVSEIETLKSIKKSIEEEISKLQKIHSNLEAQAHTAQIKDDSERGIANAEKMTQYAMEERRIEQLRISAEGRISLAEDSERKLSEREKEVERRENKTTDLEGKIDDLNKQRVNFESYKVSVSAQLDQAQATINEAKETFDKIESEKMMLAGREARVKEMEKVWNDDIGKLEEDKRQFQIEKENIIGLKKAKKEAVK
jgi:chromosome segregation ATPase